jgi:hypothetical protein
LVVTDKGVIGVIGAFPADRVAMVFRAWVEIVAGWQQTQTATPFTRVAACAGVVVITCGKVLLMDTSHTRVATVVSTLIVIVTRVGGLPDALTCGADVV